MGLNFRLTKLDPNVIGFLTQKETVVNFRAGYEWVYPMSRQLAMYWGLDGVFEHTREDVKSSSPGGTALLASRTGWAWGRYWALPGGPTRAWRLPPNAPSTPCIAGAGKDVIAPPDFSTESSHDFVWQPLLPTSLFVNFSF